jgi:protein SCO1/2
MRSEKTMKFFMTLLVAGAVLLGGAESQAQVVIDNPEEYAGMGIKEHPGESIPLDVTVTNDLGEQVSLSEYFHDGKPVILTLVYYNCPMLCNLILNGLTEGMEGNEWNPGDQYRVVTVSFNPRETPELAAAKKENYLAEFGRDVIGDGWAFCTGTEKETQRLADAVGFQYYWDEERQEYAHPSCIFVLTEDGKISRYLYGISFGERDLRLALLEASEGKIGNTIDRLLLYCFHYDPDARGYVVLASNVMKLGGGVTLLILGAFLGTLWYRERYRRARRIAADRSATDVAV